MRVKQHRIRVFPFLAYIFLSGALKKYFMYDLFVF